MLGKTSLSKELTQIRDMSFEPAQACSMLAASGKTGPEGVQQFLDHLFAGQGTNSAWKQQLADATGVKFKPEQQPQPQAWINDDDSDSETQQNATLEDIFADDWAGEDDAEGVIEDREVYNMDTGWSLTDLELDDLEPQSDEAQVQLCLQVPPCVPG